MLVLISLLGCKRASGPSSDDLATQFPSPQTGAVKGEVSAPDPPSPKPAPRLTLPRIARCHGATASGGPIGEERLAQPDELLTVPPNERCELLFPAGPSVRLHGPARARVSPRGEPLVLLRSGMIEVEVPGHAVGSASGFAWATPAVRGDIVRSGRVVVRVQAGLRTSLVVVSGRATIVVPRAAHTGAAAPAMEEPIALSAGQGLWAAPEGEPVRFSAPVGTMDGARAYLTRGEQGEGAAREPPIASLAAGLARALSEHAAAIAEESALSERHAALSARGDPSASALQGELAQKGAALFRLARAVRVRADTLEALLIEAPPVADDVLELLAQARKATP